MKKLILTAVITMLTLGASFAQSGYGFDLTPSVRIILADEIEIQKLKVDALLQKEILAKKEKIEDKKLLDELVRLRSKNNLTCNPKPTDWNEIYKPLTKYDPWSDKEVGLEIKDFSQEEIKNAIESIEKKEKNLLTFYKFLNF